MGSKSKFSVLERRKVMLSLLRHDEQATLLARRYGISEDTLFRWRDEFMVAGEAALARGKAKADLRNRQMDITYIHLPGYSRWYAMTVIDYYSWYLLACHLTNCYCALEATGVSDMARPETERLCGPLEKRPFLVTDDGTSFMPGSSVSTSRICIAMFVSSIARRCSLACWSAFVRR